MGSYGRLHFHRSCNNTADKPTSSIKGSEVITGQIQPHAQSAFTQEADINTRRGGQE